MTRIDLAQSFEKISARVLSLPVSDHHDSSPHTRERRQQLMRRLLREIYEAANGRQVDTVIGLIPIAPPIASYLKEDPIYAETQVDFLWQAFGRIAEHSLNKVRTTRGPTAKIQLRTVPVKSRRILPAWQEEAGTW